MALTPGRGRTAVPVRTTLVGLTLGLSAIAGALTFGESLSHLLATPRLYGVDWDYAITDYSSGKLGKAGAQVLAADRRVHAFALGDSGFPFLVAGRRVDVLALDSIKGNVGPPVLEGRAPGAADEIALGTKTLEALHTRLGETLVVRLPGSPRSAHVRVVGRVVLPAVGDAGRLGEGALVTYGAVRRLVPGLTPSLALLRLAPGTDAGGIVPALRPKLGEALTVAPFSKPSDLVNFGRVEKMPVTLAGALALLAAGTLAHMLVSGTRRRRRDLAVLKTLGFVRGQVIAAVAWQAMTLAAASLLIGLPTGVAAGRWAWRLLADQLGIVPESAVPLSSVLLIVPATIIAAIALAALPAWAAARTGPATVLRAE
jgi:hypothetical protein